MKHFIKAKKLIHSHKFVDFLKRTLLVTLGALAGAYSYHALIVPFGLLSGGVSGISIMLHYLTKFPYVAAMIILNIPILIWGMKELDKKYMIANIIGIALSLFAIQFLGEYIHPVKVDIFLAAIFSGVIGGLATGLFFRARVSGGGTDTTAAIMKKKKNISIGATTVTVNLVIMMASLLFFDVNITLYTLLSIYIAGRVTDVVIDGFNNNKAITIISDKNDAIALRINKELKRGVTYIHGEGAFTAAPLKVINCIVGHSEIPIVKEIVHEEDRHAFMYFTETVEVSGKGF